MPMKLHKFDDLMRQRGRTDDEIRRVKERARQEVFEMNLRELRIASGKTQTEVARVAEMTQSEVSRAETSDVEPSSRSRTIRAQRSASKPGRSWAT